MAISMKDVISMMTYRQPNTIIKSPDLKLHNIFMDIYLRKKKTPSFQGQRQLTVSSIK